MGMKNTSGPTGKKTALAKEITKRKIPWSVFCSHSPNPTKFTLKIFLYGFYVPVFKPFFKSKNGFGKINVFGGFRRCLGKVP